MRHCGIMLGLLLCLWLGSARAVRADTMQYPPPANTSNFPFLFPTPAPHTPACWEGYFAYNVLWFSRGQFPTVTTGDINDTAPGALGQPGTAVLTGDVRGQAPASGFKAGVIIWLDDPESLSFEASF